MYPTYIYKTLGVRRTSPVVVMADHVNLQWLVHYKAELGDSPWFIPCRTHTHVDVDGLYIIAYHAFWEL